MKQGYLPTAFHCSYSNIPTPSYKRYVSLSQMFLRQWNLGLLNSSVLLLLKLFFVSLGSEQKILKSTFHLFEQKSFLCVAWDRHIFMLLFHDRRSCAKYFSKPLLKQETRCGVVVVAQTLFLKAWVIIRPSRRKRERECVKNILRNYLNIILT